MSRAKVDWPDQFTKQTPQTNENYGITYDYGSIMHYGGTRFVTDVIYEVLSFTEA